MRGHTREIHIAFATSTFNEEANLDSLYERCFGAAESFEKEHGAEVRTELIIADNCSQDQSRGYLKRLVASDARVSVYFNERNYGVEASFVYALRAAVETGAEFIIMLCSDLQDPPELTGEMIRILIDSYSVDAVFGVKKKSAGGFLSCLLRRVYYEVLSLSSRMQLVPEGFHGFGCYRARVIVEMIRLWENTDLNLRQCLTNASQSSRLLGYDQSERIHGRSTYSKYRYFKEAARAIITSDAATSRVSIAIGLASSLFVVVAGSFVLINTMAGNSGYEGGTPTLMGLVLISFSIQVLLMGMLSRQIESLKMGGFRPKVYSQRI